MRQSQEGGEALRLRRWVKDSGVPSAAGLGGLDEKEAQALAERVVREVRRDLKYEPADGQAPSPEEVRRILASKRSRGKTTNE